jgi:mono/diheme cytochrome c family protein
MRGPLRHGATFVALCLSGLVAGLARAGGDAGGTAVEEWKVPTRAAKKKNPTPRDDRSIAAGKVLYTRECFSCHGSLGKGDGSAAKDLERKPGNLSSPGMWAQSDGALFYKISEGRKPMPTFEKILTEEERWLVIDFVRTLAPQPDQKEPPVVPPGTPAACRSALSGLVNAYLPVGSSLTKSDFSGARAGLPAMDDAAIVLLKLDGKDLGDQDGQAWVASTKRIRKAVSALKDADDIASLREAFRGVSEALVEALEKFGYAEKGPLFVCRCDRAFDGAGARWLQAEVEARCPYLASGDAAACQTVKTLAAATGSGKGDGL